MFRLLGIRDIALYNTVLSTERAWPGFGVIKFVDDKRVRARRENLKGLQELNEAVALVARQRVERLAFGRGLSVVRFDGFPSRGEFAMVHERAALVIETP